MFELIYTSVPRGILENRSGFCTVGCTDGILPQLIPSLESMSSCRLGKVDEYKKMIAYRRLHSGKSTYPVVSHFAVGGKDFSGHTNKTVHHLLFINDDELSCCPGEAFGVLFCEENFTALWKKEPQKLPPRKKLVSHKNPVHRADCWEMITGDAGWAGVVAEFFKNDPENQFYLVYDPETIDHTNLLVLFGEVVNLLPENERKNFTYSTFLCGNSENWECFLQAVSTDDPECEEVCARVPERCLILANAGKIPASFENSPLVDLARNMIPECSAKKSTSGEDEFSEEEILAEISGGRKNPFFLLLLIFMLLLVILGIIVFLLPEQPENDQDNIEVMEQNYQIN